jgi:NHL repeat-containing protein
MGPRRPLAALAALVALMALGTGSASAASFSESHFHIYQLQPNNPFVGGFQDPAGVAVGPKGDVMYVADRIDGRVVEMTTYGALVRTWGCCGSAPGKLKEPIGIATDAAGHVYVADQGNGRIEKYSGTGSHLKTFPMQGVFGVAVAPSGDIYALTRFFNVVVRLAANGNQLGSFTACAASQTLIPGLSESCGVRAIASDGAGNILIVLNKQVHYTEVCNPGSYYNTTTPPVEGWNEVQRFTPSGIAGASWGLPDLLQSCYQGFDPSDNATGVAVDPHGGDVYATRLEPRVDYVDSAFDLPSNGTFGRPPYPKLTPVITGQFRALAFDCASDLYVASYFGEAVIRYDNAFASSFPCEKVRNRIFAPAHLGGVMRAGGRLLVQLGCRHPCSGLLKISSGGRVLSQGRVHLHGESTKAFLLHTRFKLHTGLRLFASFRARGLAPATLRTRVLALSRVALSLPSHVQAGTAFDATGTVSPSRRGRLVRISAAGPGGALQSVLTHTHAGGRYSVRLTLPSGGSWQIFAAVQPGRGAQPAESRPHSIIVPPVPLPVRTGGPPAAAQLACPSSLEPGQTLSVTGQTLPLTAVSLTITPPGGPAGTQVIGSNAGGAFAVSLPNAAAGTWLVHASVLFGSGADCSVSVRSPETLTLSCPSNVPIPGGHGTATLTGTTAPPLPGQQVTVQATGGGGARSANAAVAGDGSFSADIPVSSADVGQQMTASASYAGDDRHQPATSPSCHFNVG